MTIQKCCPNDTIDAMLKQALIPNAPCPVVRNTLVVLCLQIFHRIVQEEVNEDRIDSVGFV